MQQTNVVSKRLHISGLTPSLTLKDIETRFSSFGKVTNISGFGTMDGNGDPRKFGHLTLDATSEMLSRCLASLSGTIWKGAKLRVGEAKPDWRDSLEIENMDTDLPRPPKRQRLLKNLDGKNSADMSPITLANASLRGAWVITPESHLVRPMRMRPLHPLEVLKKTKEKRPKTKISKSRRRIKPVLRARAVKIDTRLYGATHIVGHLLEDSIKTVSSASCTAKENDNGGESTTASDRISSYVDRSPGPSRITAAAGEMEVDDLALVVAEERSRNLSLLGAIFSAGPKKIEADALKDDFQSGSQSPNVDEVGESRNQEVEEPGSPAPVPAAEDYSTPLLPFTATTRLKNIFQAKEAPGNFDVFDDDNLDLDPEMAALFDNSRPALQVLERPSISAETHSASRHINNGRQTITLDPKLPFFFPLQGQGDSRKGIVSALKLRIGDQFTSTNDSTEIRARWNAKKGELTKDWKKRHREAVKLRQIRIGKTRNDER